MGSPTNSFSSDGQRLDGPAGQGFPCQVLPGVLSLLVCLGRSPNCSFINTLVTGTFPTLTSNNPQTQEQERFLKVKVKPACQESSEGQGEWRKGAVSPALFCGQLQSCRHRNQARGWLGARQGMQPS